MAATCNHRKLDPFQPGFGVGHVCITTKALTLKLFINTNANKVLFAEASKDFVDFLFFILSLPVATVTKFLRGPIENIYTSFSNLDQTYLRPDYNKNTLLNPVSVANFPLLTTPKVRSPPIYYYKCSHRNILKCNGITAVTDMYDAVPCPGCYKNMTMFIPFIKGKPDDLPGYVKGNASYMISDDLSVTPMSMTSAISIINKFNVSKLEEKEVIVGNNEALELLKVMFQSEDVLTRVFLLDESMKKIQLAKVDLIDVKDESWRDRGWGF